VEGTIAEGTITISKPLTLIGREGAIIDGQDVGEVIEVIANDVTIRNFTIRGSRISSINDNAGIKVKSCERTVISDNFLDKCFFAIYLSGAKDAIVERNTIIGEDDREDLTANGIHLWKCTRATIRDNRIEWHRDGIYFEFVTDSKIHDNHARNCNRYGLHFMFSHRNAYTDNIFENNGAGVAVMFSREIRMTDNQFLSNRGASAYGLLLKEINDGEIINNTFSDNTTGIMLDGCNRIKVHNNLLHKNGYALRVFANAMNCSYAGNSFSGNTFDMSTNGTLMDNVMEGNYWDRYVGYDLDRDGHGDVPHRPLGFFTLLVEKQPYAMVFSRSLFVSLLDRAERLIPSLSPASLKDDKPLMRAPARPKHKSQNRPRESWTPIAFQPPTYQKENFPAATPWSSPLLNDHA
jgi:nitrous oxidase accessory protein